MTPLDVLAAFGMLYGSLLFGAGLFLLLTRHRTVRPFPPVVQPVVEDQLYDRVVDDDLDARFYALVRGWNQT